MKAIDIIDMEAVNPVDNAKVEKIYNSIMENGWNGAPILV